MAALSTMILPIVVMMQGVPIESFGTYLGLRLYRENCGNPPESAI